MEPIACAARDPESKGIVEGGVRYVKRSALAGRREELVTWEDYRRLAPQWRDEVANVRLHAATQQRPIDRFQEERAHLRPLPPMAFDTDEVLPVIVTPHARVRYDGNRYSVPPSLVRKPVTLRANATAVWIVDQGREVTRHPRCYERGRLVVHPDDRLAALKLRRRRQASQCEEEFDALGPLAREFHLKLLSMPVKTTVHLRRLLGLVRLYGRREVLAAIVRAMEYKIHDAAYVEALLLQERRRRELPSPTPLQPKRRELIEDIRLEEPDPARYDRLCGNCESEPEEPQA
jgi:Mu transposase, C-terminal domain